MRVLLVLLLSAVFAAQAADVVRKENVAVISLQNRGGLTESELALFTDKVDDELFRSNFFNILEREQISDILKEQGFQQTGACTDQECLVQVGQLLSVKRIISGSIGKFENEFVISLKIIDVETGKIIGKITKNYRGTKTKLFEDGVADATKTLLINAQYVPEALSKKPEPNSNVVWYWVGGVVAVGAIAGVVYIAAQPKKEAGTGTLADTIPLPSFPSRGINNSSLFESR